jgi:nucleoside-diphosphate-sugar epimerase
LGRHLCEALARHGYLVTALSRRPDAQLDSICSNVEIVPDLAAATDLAVRLSGADAVVHLAGRAHVIGDKGIGATDAYQRNNLLATRILGEASMAAGIGKFVFLSTIKVFGDGPFAAPLAPSRRPEPDDDYGASKLSAEDWLLAPGPARPGKPIIIRPPLIYGPGVRANFLQLMRLVDRGIPLPLAGVQNVRSLVNVWNLCSLIICLIEQRAEVRGIWHVSDGEDCSTAELIREIAASLGTSARLFRLPDWLLSAAMLASGRAHQYRRLIGSLQVDMSQTIERLPWSPSVSRQEGLDRTLRWYRQGRASAPS